MTASSPLPETAGPAPGPWAPPAERPLQVVSDVLRVVGPYERHGKRVLDVLGATALLILLSPILAFTALAVRLRLGAPVFFRQRRVGRHGAEFDVVKFRSMHNDRRCTQENFNGDDRRQVHKTDDDPRHTSLGRRIRKWSLDELPQLLNVARGEMSLVGPRPELADVARRHGLVDHPRHLVRPGMTGLWQVSAERQGLLYENVDIDLEYVERITFRGDLKILLRTVGAVVRASGS